MSSIFFCGELIWKYLYGHSPSSSDSQRAAYLVTDERMLITPEITCSKKYCKQYCYESFVLFNFDIMITKQCTVIVDHKSLVKVQVLCLWFLPWITIVTWL